MSIELISDVWGVLRDHIDLHDRKEAADGLVNLLVENDYGATEIKTAFRGDKDIAMALKFFAEQQDPEGEVEEDQDEDHDEWD